MFFSWLLRTIRRRGLLPTISDTERAALEAGTVWIEGDLFRGRPDFRRLMSEPYPTLSAEEQAFLDGPVEELCRMADPWALSRAKDIPESIWAFLREHRFFGLMIPKEYGGHGFTPLATSAVFGKIGTHSITLNTVVVIPNSIGPAELLAHCGTREQKDTWLPRLARGDEIPCFALTEPRAGSDAASMTSTGTLFKRPDGTLAIRLDWDKRYITLAPIATLLGLAFKLRDPENLLGKGLADVGITCALVPTHLDGVEIGRRHDPMGPPFANGPTRGRGVVLDASNIIGGIEYAGKGWQMLMEALAGGRAIGLPSGSAAGAKAIARGVGAYAFLRKQFGLSIGKFEGIQEPLARIAGRAYLMEATRIFVGGAVHTGQKPSVASAIAKYNLTELARRSVTDGMDVLAGKGISRGPTNPLADGYTAAPVGITVEGANILTRTLIVFGQGALRCHPYLQREVKAVESGDAREFRRALFGHLFHATRSSFRTVVLGFTRALFASGRPFRRPLSRYVRRLKWASAQYAFMTELALLAYGGRLKQRGRMTGRFADILSWMLMATATLRRFKAEGEEKADLPLVRWGLETALHEIQQAFESILQNFRAPVIGWPVRVLGTFFARLSPIGRAPSDTLGEEVAELLLAPGATRDRLTAGLFLPDLPTTPLARLEHAFRVAHAAEPALKKVKDAIRTGKIPRRPPERLATEAHAKGILSADELRGIEEAERARDSVLAVDEFTAEEYFGSTAAAITTETEALVAG